MPDFSPSRTAGNSTCIIIFFLTDLFDCINRIFSPFFSSLNVIVLCTGCPSRLIYNDGT